MRACRRRLSILLTVISCCCYIAGCIPVTEHYQRAETPDASYLRGTCGDSGPPDWTYYSFHGIHISVSPSSSLQVGLHYPAGTTASLDSNRIELRGWRGDKAINIVAFLHPALHAALGNLAPERFEGMRDPTDPEGLHRYRRYSSDKDVVWANFLAYDEDVSDHFIRVPKGLDRGVIVVPAMTVNGQSYGPQELLIVRRLYSGVLPINC